MAKKPQKPFETFAARLNAALTANDKSWVALGEKLGISRAAYKKWRDGPTIPTADKCFQIADWLKINVRWLVLNEGDMATPTPLGDDQRILLATFDQLLPPEQRAVLEHADSLLYRHTRHTGPGKPFKVPAK